MSTVAKKPEEKKVERKVEAAGPNSLQLAEHARNIWSLEVPMGVQPDDLLEPSFWAHHSGKLAPYDKIEVRAKDGTWYQELIVMDSSRAWARVRPLLDAVRFSSADVSQSETAQSEYEIVHRAQHMWSVVRKKDRQVVHEGERQRDGAETWLKDNLPKLKVGALT